MANDIDLWQDLIKQEKFIKYCKEKIKTDAEWQDTLTRAKLQYKNMLKEYQNKYINN
jgi:hypothetical protein